MNETETQLEQYAKTYSSLATVLKTFAEVMESLPDNEFELVEDHKILRAKLTRLWDDIQPTIYEMKDSTLFYLSRPFKD